MKNLERELRDMMGRTADGLEHVPRADRGLVRRARLRRARTAAIAGAAACSLVIGGFAGTRSLSNDEVPPVNPEPRDSAFLGIWFNADIDDSNQTMVVRALSDEAYEIEVRDDSAGVCSGAPSLMTGIGRLEDAGRLVIPSPEFTCNDGTEPKVEGGPTIEELLHNLTFVHNFAAGTLTDSLGLLWSRDEIPRDAARCEPPRDRESLPRPECMRGEQVPETEVASGDYKGTPWRLSVFTEPVIGENHAEGYHSLGLTGFLGDERFVFVSGIRPDSALEGTSGTKLWAFKEGLQDVLVVSGTVAPDIVRVAFSEGGLTRSVETLGVPAEVGDFRVYVLFAPFGTDVGCLRWDIETLNCFGAQQRVLGFDAAGGVVAEERLHPSIGRDCLVCSEETDPDGFVAKGSEGGLEWRLSARRYGSERCFAFSLGSETAGGRACLTRPGSGWFGEVGQRVEPDRPEVAPVYGAVPPSVDEVDVVLQDGSTIPARIFRPPNHSLAYYLAWIPDAYASGSVRFIAQGRELGSLPLCAAEHRARTRDFVCYGTPEPR